MKISSISNFYRTNFSERKAVNQTNPFLLNAGYTGDIVSFRAKNYDIDQIVNQTNHCAYCGCKVYSEAQIESLAKGMLQGKANRLQGDIKSVLEKLESAVRSEELTFAKKVENSEEIDFFKKFLQISNDKGFLKGEAIFQQVYGMDSQEALAILKRNMRPITKTVDHVSPQNLEEENNNSDINLVEACYCCNHDLKKGVSFAEFYTMFPSIKENMPPDKFNYAHSNLMASSASSVLSRLSATSLLSHVQRLFGQRDEALNRVGSINFRILEANSSISKSIQDCNDEIQEKKTEIDKLQAKLDSLATDDEYNAIVKRVSLTSQKSQIETAIDSLKGRRSSVSNLLNEIRNPSRKQKKQSKVEMSKAEKEQKIAELKQALIILEQDIKQQESQRDDIELEIMELNDKFPTVEMLQVLKNKIDFIISSYAALRRENISCEQLENLFAQHQQSLDALNTEIALYPDKPFDPLNYSQEEQDDYSRYTQLVEALKHIDTHSSGGGIKAIINVAARKNIEDEIIALEGTTVVKDANSYEKRTELQASIDSLIKQQENVKNQIATAQKNIARLNSTVASKTLEEAQQESSRYSEDIRRISEKQNFLKLPQTIATLKAEILLLQTTINDLQTKQVEIANLS